MLRASQTGVSSRDLKYFMHFVELASIPGGVELVTILV